MVQRSTSVIESVPTPNPQKPPESRVPGASEVPEDGSQPDRGRRAARTSPDVGRAAQASPDVGRLAQASPDVGSPALLASPSTYCIKKPLDRELK